MRWILLLACACGSVGLSACAPADADAADARGHSVDVRLVTFNMENFFDAYDDPYVSDEDAWPKPKNPSIAQGEVLREADPDFLGVEEIENEGILLRFRGWNLANRGYDYYWVGQSIGTRGINNGFLSRVPVGAISVYRYEKLTLPHDDRKRTWSFARELTAVELKPADDVRLTVFVAHLKSKRTVDDKDPQSADWRLAEAIRIRRLIDERLDADPEALIALLGDLNDTPDSRTIRTLLDPGPGGRVALVDPHADVPAEKSDTYLRDPYRAKVDYTLLSPALARRVVAESAKIYNTRDTGSDHAPVGVTLRLPTAVPDARKHWPTGEPEEPLRTFFDKKKSPDGEPEPEPVGAGN